MNDMCRRNVSLILSEQVEWLTDVATVRCLTLDDQSLNIDHLESGKPLIR